MSSASSHAATSGASQYGPRPPDDQRILAAITAFELSPSALSDWVVTPASGAVLTFAGTVRETSLESTGVVSITYEAYEEVAVAVLTRICSRMLGLWPELERAAMMHRIGEVPLSEASVAIAVSSPHRPEAFESLAFGIDVLKMSLPIWKTEHGESESAPVRHGTDLRTVDQAVESWLDGYRPGPT